jgi:hypothetical protein
MPAAPALIPHAWPFPGMTPEDSARAEIAHSAAYDDMLAAVIKSHPGGPLTAKQLLAMIPADWQAICGKYVHASLDIRPAAQRGVEVTYTPHDDGGFHFSYRAAA